MRAPLTQLICGLGVALCWGASLSVSRAAPVERPASSRYGVRALTADEIERRTANGFDLGRFHGSPVLLDIWASWCAPCLAELPKVRDLAGALADRGVVVVPLSIDRGGPWMAARGYSRAGASGLPLVMGDPAEISARFKIRTLPTVLLFDRHGREIARYDGQRSLSLAAVVDALGSGRSVPAPTPLPAHD